MLIQNEYLLVEIAAAGAELMRIFDKERGVELLWDGDPAFWKRRSPVLFPNVGKNWKNTMRLNGVAYATSQHGFARDSMFDLKESSDTRVSYVLSANADTLAKYPYDFELEIVYSLEGKALNVEWIVSNRSEDVMPFTIGGHPAFRFTGEGESKSDYCLCFPGMDRLEYILLDPAFGAADPGKVHGIPLTDGCLLLSEELFANDALILDGAQVREVWLCRKDRTPVVGMRCEGFPNYGIWSVNKASFVCLEPWMGRCDDCGFEEEFSRKANVNLLASGERFEKAYQILIP